MVIIFDLVTLENFKHTAQRGSCSRLLYSIDYNR
jgi:hypothetical protein